MRMCFIRAEVMRGHHDAMVHEALDQGGLAHVAESELRKARFITYVSYWFTALAAVIERYQELSGKGTIPSNADLDALLTDDMINLVKPFRNAIAHCSDHDDDRVLGLLENAPTVPDWAEKVATSFRSYFALHDEPPETGRSVGEGAA